jgi:hypothetical protein
VVNDRGGAPFIGPRRKWSEREGGSCRQLGGAL